MQPQSRQLGPLLAGKRPRGLTAQTAPATLPVSRFQQPVGSTRAGDDERFVVHVVGSWAAAWPMVGARPGPDIELQPLDGWLGAHR